MDDNGINSQAAYDASFDDKGFRARRADLDKRLADALEVEAKNGVIYGREVGRAAEIVADAEKKAAWIVMEAEKHAAKVRAEVDQIKQVLLGSVDKIIGTDMDEPPEELTVD